MSIITFHGVSLTMGGNVLLDNVDWQIEANDRMALVGRNGAGKSSLLKLLMNELVADKGEIHRINGLTVAGLMQDVPVIADESVYYFIVSSLGARGEVLARFYALSLSHDLEAISKAQREIDDLHLWDELPKIDMMASRLGIPLQAKMGDLSGGMKRRVLLAAALIAAPGLLLLDEPTNHLDVNAIEWLEAYLKTYSGCVLLVTHDRAFLEAVANHIVEIDRGRLQGFHCDYETFLSRREGLRMAEEKSHALFDKRLSEEEVWIRTGVKARRTRNEGRVRALKSMREAHQKRRVQQGNVQGLNLDVSRSGAIVLEAKEISYCINGKPLIKPLSLLVTRGDKIGIIGPNGCGKTTLLRLLLGELMPDTGSARQGTSLQIAYFDQLRLQLDDSQTVMFNVADGADYVTINGQKKHVASYLRDFLFSPERFNQSVSTLSGGEKNRLLLARLLAKPVNLLVMDEPTNDLDIETLELLETLLVDYPGTLLLISHDRAFINNVVASVLVYEGEGVFNEYVGGYDDYKLLIKEKQKSTTLTQKVEKRVSSSVKLNFNEQRELANLPKQIEVLEVAIAKAHEQMAQADFYQQPPEHISEFSKTLQQDEAHLAQLYQRWEQLEAKN